MNNNNNFKISLVLVFTVIFILPLIFGMVESLLDTIDESKNNSANNNVFRIISSSENKDFDALLKEYANQNNIDVQIDYAGTLEIMNKLNQGENYDAVWCSNSIWLYMLDGSVKVSDSKSTNTEPVIFAVTKSKAEELGFINEEIYTEDIVNAIQSGDLKFSMANPTRTNTGATAYLGLLTTLAGSPEILREENLQEEELKENLVSLFSGMERTSGEEDFLEEIFLNGDYDAVVSYESSIIRMNKTLEAEGKEVLYALYPKDGVSISDSPFAYINNGNDNKKEIFKALQSYVLSSEGQKKLQEYGRRTWYGGINKDADKTIFNPDWGIDTENYIATVKYPSTNVIKKALALYQSELRKPTHVAFCLDYSGSMYGTGNKQLVSAMEYILNEETASKDLLQFSEKDKITVIPFSTSVLDIWETDNGLETADLINKVNNQNPTGATALYPACQKALEILNEEDLEYYNLSIIVMTDGEANVGSLYELQNDYYNINKDIPIYSIMFGDAKEKQLIDIANLTNAKVFDGRTNLLEAFKEVRGYN